MTQEDKELLLKDLSMRLPYHVKVKIWHEDRTAEEGPLDLENNCENILQDAFYFGEIKNIKPYLRPLSSMTEEERKEWYRRSHVDYDPEYKTDPTLSLDNCHLSIDWLNEHHFDYRGLIEKGLALEAPKEMYN